MAESKPLDPVLEGIYPGLTIDARYDPPPRMWDTGARTPDPAWQFIDPAGHLHAWVDYGDKIRPALPTLVYAIDSEADDEYPETGHYECKACRIIDGLGSKKAPNRTHSAKGAAKKVERRTVAPGYKAAPPGSTPPGPLVVTLTLTETGRQFRLPEDELDTLLHAAERYAIGYLAANPDAEIPGELRFDSGQMVSNGVVVDPDTVRVIAPALGIDFDPTAGEVRIPGPLADRATRSAVIVSFASESHEAERYLLKSQTGLVVDVVRLGERRMGVLLDAKVEGLVVGFAPQAEIVAAAEEALVADQPADALADAVGREVVVLPWDEVEEAAIH